MAHRRRTRVILIGMAVILLGIGYALLVRKGIGIPCLFYQITGLRCPGCGISRSLASLLTLRVDLFLQYNLFSPFIVLYILALVFISSKNYIQKGKFIYLSPCKWIDIAMLSITVL